jgi:hypothetical protein
VISIIFDFVPANVTARFDISHFATQPKAKSSWDAAFDYVDSLNVNAARR